MKELMQKVKEDYAALLPTVVNNIGELHGKYYFDFSSNSYIAVEEGFNGIEIPKKKPLSSEIEVPLYRSFSNLGIIIPRVDPEQDDRTKEEIERVFARIAKCDQELAYLRDELAAIAPEDRVIPDFTLTEWKMEV